MGRHYGARSATGPLDHWLVHDTDDADVPGVTVTGVPLLMTDPEPPRTWCEPDWSWPGPTVTDHGSAARIEVLPVTGLPEFRPGDDLAAAIAEAAPWLRGRRRRGRHQQGGVQARGSHRRRPADPDERDALRRTLIEDEAVRVLARKGRTLITENRHGLIQAAAGVDGSNIGTTELALLPDDPDASAASLRDALCGTVREWTSGGHHRHDGRRGVTDRSMQPSDRPVCRCCTAMPDRLDSHGNELVVTEIAVADESAAADLVKAN